MNYMVSDYLLVSIPIDFRLSWGKMGYSRHLFLTITDQKGHTGVGEGILYKTTHLKLLPFLEVGFPLEPEKLVDFEPGLAYAVDTAFKDLNNKLVEADYSRPVVREIFLEDSNLEENITKALKKNTTALKLKVGKNVRKDLETIKKVYGLCGGKVKIHLDANRGYTYDQALALAKGSIHCGVSLFEEPFRGDLKELKKFRGEVKIPIMLDESVLTLRDFENAINNKALDILNIKLCRLGGITEAKKYISQAEKSGIRIYLGCSEELGIGTSAIFSLAKEVNNLYAVEGFGEERLNVEFGKKEIISHDYRRLQNKGAIIYQPNHSSRQVFLTKEFLGIWKTRAENVYLKLRS